MLNGSNRYSAFFLSFSLFSFISYFSSLSLFPFFFFHFPHFHIAVMMYIPFVLDIIYLPYYSSSAFFLDIYFVVVACFLSIAWTGRRYFFPPCLME